MELLLVPAWMTPPPDADAVLLAGLRSSSRTAYLRELTEWRSFLARRAAPRTSAEVDLALWEYLRPMRRGRASTVLAAIEKVNPALHGQLPFSRALVGVLQVTSAIRHHLPMSWNMALVVAEGMCRLNRPREGALLLLQWRIAARPREALELEGGHLTPGHRNHITPGVSVVNLGVRHGTKVRRPQAVVLPEDDWRAAVLIRAFSESTGPLERLSTLRTTAAYHSLLRSACVAVGLPQWWSPHCPRAGWATENWMAGKPFADLKAFGRWKNDNSLQVYLDSVSVLQHDSSPELAPFQRRSAQLDATFEANWSWLPSASSP